MPTTTEAAPTVPREVADHLVHANYWDPFAVLGSHKVDLDSKPARAIRAFLPQASKAWVVTPSGKKGETARTPMKRIHTDGLFELVVPGQGEAFPYRLAVENHEGHIWDFEDPYRFGPVLSDFDLHLFGEGTHYKSYEKLGAHLITHEGARGVHFAVWAPNALRVSVVGNFNHWDGRRHPMRACSGGIWEVFLPELTQGEVYKFEIKSRYNNYLVEKADPYGFAAEFRPKTASVVWDITQFSWGDRRLDGQDRASPAGARGARCRSTRSTSAPGSGRSRRANRFLNYRELADALVNYLRMRPASPTLS